MTLILLLGLALLGASVALAARGLAAPRARAAQRLDEIGSYGYSAQTLHGVPQPDEQPGGLSSLAAGLGGLVTRRLGRVSESDLRDELLAAGMYTMSPRTLLGYRIFVAAGFGALMLIVTAASDKRFLLVLLTLMAVAAGWMFPLIVVRRRARQRVDKIERRLPELIDLLVVTVEAGLGFSGSLRIAAREFSGPLADELRLTLQEQTMGLSVNDSLANMLRRADTPGMRSFVRSVIQGETLGVSTANIMRGLAVEMRTRRRQRAEMRAQQAPIKLLFPLIFFIFPTLFIVLLIPALLQFKDVFG